MKKILIVLILFFTSERANSQIDSIKFFKTGYIFSIEFTETDSSNTNMDEVRIVSLSEKTLNIDYFKKENIAVLKKIELNKIKKIGYKSGNNGWKYAAYGFLGSAASTYLTLQIFSKAIKKGENGDQDGYSTLLTAISIPVIAGIVGGLVGIATDNYLMFDMKKYKNVNQNNFKSLQMIIDEGVKFSN